MRDPARGSETSPPAAAGPLRLAMMIPTYNERDNLAELVEALMGLAVPDAAPLRLVIVDDDSPDGTGRLADQLAAAHPGRIRVVHRRGERGRASAGLAGFRAALADPELTHIGEMDADGSHDPADLPALIEAVRTADIAIGSRYVPGGTSVGCTRLGRWRSVLINRLNQVLLGLGVADSSGGYKIYARAVLEALPLEQFHATAYAIGVETLWRARRAGFRMVERPITFRNRTRGQSKLDRQVLFEYPRTLFRLWREDRAAARTAAAHDPACRPRADR